MLRHITEEMEKPPRKQSKSGKLEGGEGGPNRGVGRRRDLTEKLVAVDATPGAFFYSSLRSFHGDKWCMCCKSIRVNGFPFVYGLGPGTNFET